jgi:hypothetical protein
MALDQVARNTLRVAVQKIRNTLTKDLEEILEATYGIHRSGVFDAVSELPELQHDRVVRETRELLERLLPPPGKARPERDRFEAGFDSVLRSLAFTHLNRLVAFKMMEQPSRKILKETVGRGLESRGFKFYLADHPDEEALWRAGGQHEAYRRFLLWQSRQLYHEMGVLFDPNDLASRVLPRPRALDAAIALLNSAEIEPVWDHEEAIGWVYQYYTPKEDRERARKASSAPRNSWEMAFLNQFYTPHYVVRFLVENTLGRIWLEMRPDTALVGKCKLLVRRPGEQLARRPRKDPREIRVMDPACGSGHFLLYAFDLFNVIYREAWDDDELGPLLRREYSDLQAFETRIPALIVEHNLYGIDIDRRAVQLASLTLFLKARSHSREVPIERSNIVCAAPMPGERGLFEEFKKRELPVLGAAQGVYAELLDGLRAHLALADEAGSLLLAERELARLVIEQRDRWRRERGSLPFGTIFDGGRGRNGEEPADDAFWAGLEGRVERLLADYAAEAEGAEGVARRLFARDGVEVLRFLDALRQEYDVVLMNPPFGAPTRGSKAYIEANYPRTKNDVYAAFVERWLYRLVHQGRLGAITSRTGFFLKSFSRWRQEVLLEGTHIDVVADLGQGVLDTAMVETAAYVLERRTRPDAGCL